MLPILTLAAALAVTPPSSIVLAADSDRAITFRDDTGSFRSVPFANPADGVTLVSGVTGPMAAPPLIAYTAGDRQFIAPIGAPEKAQTFPARLVSLQCNAVACLAWFSDNHASLLGLDNRPVMDIAPAGVVLAADPGGFLIAGGAGLERVDNAGNVTFNVAVAHYPAAAEFDGSRYVVVSTDGGFRATPLSLSGDVGPATTIAALPDGAFYGVAIAHSAGQHLVAFAWTDHYTEVQVPGALSATHLLGVRLDAALQPIDTTPFLINDESWAEALPVIASRDGGFVVAWDHSANFIVDFDAEAAMVGADATVGPRMLLDTPGRHRLARH